MSYPILDVIPEVKTALQTNPVVILQAPPGAGKSTILPLHLLDEPWLQGKKMIMLEPRRLAARSVSQRMASVLGEETGKTVGYRIRFENVVSDNTRIEVVTEGILTRMIQSDNTLSQVGLLLFDEFHERSLAADLALALSLQVQGIVREDLRVLIMSATIDTGNLSSLLGNAAVITSSGKLHPVTILYNKEQDNAPVAMKTARAAVKALREQPGDILVFLPGAGEIKRTKELLETENTGSLIYPLYGDLPFNKQQEAIMPDPPGVRKIVLATSIAETSLTIEGITTVIDSGLSRVPRFDPRSALTRLETIPVTKDAADQRAGRAGRLGPGTCYRLWTEGKHRHLIAQRSPEILEADLAPMMLELANWGVENITELTWITHPPTGAVQQATELLKQLGALKDNKITERGKQMVRLPIHPRLAHMLIEASGSHRLLALATDIAALLEERDPLQKESSGADLTLRVELLRKWRDGSRSFSSHAGLERIERLAANWRKLFKIKVSNEVVSDEETGLLLAAAYPERIAQQVSKNGDRYRLANGRTARLPAHDPLISHNWLVVAHLDAGDREGKIFLTAPVRKQDLNQLAVEEETVRWDDERGMIVASREKRVGNLVLESAPLMEVPYEKRVAVLCDVIRSKGLKMIGWGEEEERWQARVMSLRKWRPQESWPDVSDEHLLATLEEWLSPFLIGVSKRADIQRMDKGAVIASLLPWDLHTSLDELAPVRLKVPSGSAIKIIYFQDGRPPVMEVRLQEVFGMLETPQVNEGRTAIMMHLLSPGFRPVQITKDLKSFWQNTYHDIRKELRMRYPKHSWPEDPWTATAVRGVKRK